MKRIFLLLSVCAVLGTAGCCCHGHNDCMDDCGNYSQGGYGEGCDGGRHRHCNLFRHRQRNCPDGGCQVDGQVQAVDGYQGGVQYVGDAGYQGDGRCQSSGCRSKLRRHRHRKSCPQCGREYVGGVQGAISPCCGESMCDCCGGDCGVTQAGFCSGGDCGAMGGNCQGGNCGGCANGNCGGAAPAPGAVPPGAPTPATTSMSHPYDELQALQAAGWTIMESPGASSPTTVNSGSTLEPVPAPPTSMTAPPVPVRPAGSR